MQLAGRKSGGCGSFSGEFTESDNKENLYSLYKFKTILPSLNGKTDFLKWNNCGGLKPFACLTVGV